MYASRSKGGYDLSAFYQGARSTVVTDRCDTSNHDVDVRFVRR